MKLRSSFGVSRKRFVRLKGFENEFSEITRFELTAGEDENEILCRPDVDALSAAPHGFEHA